jgi:hypothetical protein
MVRKYIPLGILLGLLLVIIGTNYAPNTVLTGWDNLHPEFNFVLNIKRSLFAVWQEYQGLGLMGGMGHASDLPRQLILWVTSIVVPANLLRYAWTFGMLAAGALGMYALLQNYRVGKLGSLLGALYYLTNLATVQMFYAPFEAFTTHFGFLPWLFLTAENVRRGNTKWSYVWFTIVSLLSATQAYVPTVFLVYAIALGIWSITCWVVSQTPKQTAITVFKLWLVTFLVNAFWLIPFLSFTATHASVAVHAKINQMATEEVYLKNQVFGTIGDALMLKGFWLDTFDFNPTENALLPIMSSWRSYIDSPIVMIIGGIFILTTVIGAWISVRNKKQHVYWVVALSAVCILFLTTQTPPFSWINEMFRHIVPLWAQIFRMPFTKFGILTAFCYSLLFAIGIEWCISFIRKVAFRLITVVCVAACCILWSYPMFSGHLFYPAVRQQIPKEYHELFTYLQTQPGSVRIANLPQSTYWGWTYERWGYTGSGFIWYGITQPIIDRAFDVWSASNENYYWELSRALYSKNVAGLSAVLSKYGIQYIILDENMTTAGNTRSLYVDETKEFLSKTPFVKTIQTFGAITLYEYQNTIYNTFVAIFPRLPSVMPLYNWTDNDAAYKDLGNYIFQSTIDDRQSAAVLYPFRSLFTKRATGEREFSITETDKQIIVASPVAATATGILKERALVYDSDNGTDLTASKIVQCGILRNGSATATDEIDPDGTRFLRFTSANQRGCLSYAVGDLPHKNAYLIAVESRHQTGRPLMFSLINMTAKHTELEVYLENSKILNPKSKTEWQTYYFILPPLASDGLGYNPYISNDAIGRQQSVNDLRRIRIYEIPYDELVSLHTFKGSTLQGVYSNQNIEVEHPNPAYYKIQVASDTGQETGENQTLVLSQSYDDGWIAWKTETCDKGQATSKTSFLSRVPCLVSPYVPFLFGTRLTEHVLVNNWANGWIVDNKTERQEDNQTHALTVLPSQNLTVYIFFWPQLLEWIGFILLPVPFLILLKKR